MHKRYASLLFALCFVAALLLSPAYAHQSGTMKTAKIGVLGEKDSEYLVLKNGL